MTPAETLLEQLADVMNQLHLLGVHPTPRHGAVMTDVGYVLPNLDNVQWAVRMKVGQRRLVPFNDFDDE